MKRELFLAACLLGTLAGPAAAAEPGPDAAMTRVIACKGDDANMEVYIPQAVASVGMGAALTRALAQPVIGYYTLDLSDANKGKTLEPVKVSISADGKTVIVNQYTRHLPPTRIPIGGGTVDFDQRFGTGAKCEPFQP